MDLYSAATAAGVVCAPHFAAVEAGRETLAEGGNAVEAMVAMAASIAAVYPHMNHLGGDASGSSANRRAACAPSWRPDPRACRLSQSFIATTRPCDPWAARGADVPGAVGGWLVALEAAKANGGRLPLDVLLATATTQARNGYTVTRSQARLTREQLPA